MSAPLISGLVLAGLAAAMLVAMVVSATRLLVATSWPRPLRQQPSPRPAGMDELSGRTGYGYTWW
jgi:hypothetical protein